MVHYLFFYDFLKWRHCGSKQHSFHSSFDVSFRCVAVGFNEEFCRRGEKKKKLCKKPTQCEGKVDIHKLQTARCVSLCAFTSAHRPYNGTHLLFYLISCVGKRRTMTTKYWWPECWRAQPMQLRNSQTSQLCITLSLLSLLSVALSLHWM